MLGHVLQGIRSPVEQVAFAEELVVQNRDDVRRGAESRLSSIEEPVDLAVGFERRVRLEPVLVRVILADDGPVERARALTAGCSSEKATRHQCEEQHVRISMQTCSEEKYEAE